MKDEEFFLEQVGGANGKEFTFGKLCTATFKITDPTEAKRFYNGYVQWLRTRPDLTEKAELVAQSNIGYFFGEGMPAEQQRMWNEATGSSHPIFGMMLAGEDRLPTQEIFDSGQRMGEASKKKGGFKRQMAKEKERFENAQKEGDAR